MHLLRLQGFFTPIFLVCVHWTVTLVMLCSTVRSSHHYCQSVKSIWSVYKRVWTVFRSVGKFYKAFNTIQYINNKITIMPLLHGFSPITGDLWNVTPMIGEGSLYCIVLWLNLSMKETLQLRVFMWHSIKDKWFSYLQNIFGSILK